MISRCLREEEALLEYLSPSPFLVSLAFPMSHFPPVGRHISLASMTNTRFRASYSRSHCSDVEGQRVPQGESPLLGAELNLLKYAQHHPSLAMAWGAKILSIRNRDFIFPIPKRASHLGESYPVAWFGLEGSRHDGLNDASRFNFNGLLYSLWLRVRLSRYIVEIHGVMGPRLLCRCSTSQSSSHRKCIIRRIFHGYNI